MSETNREWLIEVLAANGRVQRQLELAGSELELGRRGRELAFADDALMADRHARLVVSQDGVEISDSGEGSGVWLRVRGGDGRLLALGDQIWLGAQILVVAREHDRWVLRHHTAEGRQLGLYALPESGLFIGRGSELVLDRADRALSRRHAQIVFDQGVPRIYDRGAHNGTFLKLTHSEPLEAGSEVRIAMQHLRFVQKERAPRPVESPRRAAPLASGGGTREGPRRPSLASRLRALGPAAPSIPSADMPSAGPLESETEPIPSPTGHVEARDVAADRLAPVPGRSETPRIDGDEKQAPDEEPSRPIGAHVEVEDIGPGRDQSADAPLPETVVLIIDSEDGAVTLEVEAGKTVLEAVKEAGLERGSPVDWECGDGGCGVCVLGVVEGAGRMDPPDPATGEMKTIQITEQVVPDPNQYRLACLARVRGAVRLRKLT